MKIIVQVARHGFHFAIMIESVPKEKYDIPIPPVQIRFDECIGCVVCARVCTKMTWDAIRMIGTDTFEENCTI